MSSKLATELVPSTFEVPCALETEAFRLRMLTVNDVVKDFDAVISSAEELCHLWPDATWPEGLTVEQNLIGFRLAPKRIPAALILYLHCC